MLSNKVLPQIKGRVFESLATKSLLLVERDPWNTIEKWLIPNKHFIYWDSLNDLNDKIYEISKNFWKYEGIVENGYKKIKNFAFENFIKSLN